MLVSLGGEGSAKEWGQTLRYYAEEGLLVRVQLASNPKPVLMRIHRVDGYLFHALLLDERTYETIGRTQAPLQTCMKVECLDADNTWRKVRQLYDLPAAEIQPAVDPTPDSQG